MELPPNTTVMLSADRRPHCHILCVVPGRESALHYFGREQSVRTLDVTQRTLRECSLGISREGCSGV